MLSSSAKSALENFKELPDEAIVRVPAALILLGWSKSTLYRRIRSGELHLAKIGPRMSGLRAGDLRQVLEAA